MKGVGGSNYKPPQMNIDLANVPSSQKIQTGGQDFNPDGDKD